MTPAMSTLVPPLPTVGRPLPTKVVIRLLPPTLTESDLLAAIPEDLLAGSDWRQFCPGVRPARPTPETPTVNARMYLNFKSFPLASDFITKFHGKGFIDDKGETYRAVVAFAPFQRVPRAWKQLKNPSDGSIEQEAHFIDFLAREDAGGVKILNVKPTQFSLERKPGYVTPLVKSLTGGSRTVEKHESVKVFSAKPATANRAKPNAATANPKTAGNVPAGVSGGKSTGGGKHAVKHEGAPSGKGQKKQGPTPSTDSAPPKITIVKRREMPSEPDRGTRATSTQGGDTRKAASQPKRKTKPSPPPPPPPPPPQQ